MIWALASVLLLAIHLLLLQLASAGPLVCVLLESLAGRTESSAAEQLVRTVKRLAKACIVSLMAGSLMGLLLAWLAMTIGPRDYSAVMRRFYPRIWWGGWELLFYCVVMLAYWLGFDVLTRQTLGRWLHRMLAVAAATNLLYHFPPLLTLMVDSLNEPAVPTEGISSLEIRALMATQSVVVKSLHFALASFAVVGAWLMGQSRSAEETAMAQPSRRWGAIVAVVAIALQLLTGMWLVVLASPAEQARLLGRDLWSTGLLIVGVLGSLVALNVSGGIALGDFPEVEPALRRCRLAAALTVLVVVAMVGMTARLGGLAG